MSLAQITLTTNKTVSNVGDYVRKIGQGEKGQVLPVLVTDVNGSAYDLTGKNLVFSENKDSGAIVVDDGSDANSGKFTPVDLKNGRFDYTLQKQVYMEDGTCWFDIVNQDGTVVDTTRSFEFVVIPDANINVNSDSYVSSLDGLIAHVKSAGIANNSINIDKLSSNLQNGFYPEVTEVKIDHINTGYISYLDGKVMTDKSANPDDGDPVHTDMIAVKPDEEYYVCTQNYWNGKAVTFYNQDKIVSSSPAESDNQRKFIKITIPYNVNGIILNGTQHFLPRLFKVESYFEIPQPVKSIANLIKNQDYNFEKVELTKKAEVGYWNINADGNFLIVPVDKTVAQISYEPIKVEPFEVYRISGCSAWDARLYEIIDAKGHLIDYCSTKMSTNMSETIMIPENGAYLEINEYLLNTTTKLERATSVRDALPLDGEKWAAVGDSWTAIYDKDGKSYVNDVAQITGAIGVNLGGGGTGYLTGGPNDWNYQFYKHTIPSDSDICTIFGSFNDAYYGQFKFGQKGDSGTDTLWGALLETINNAYKANPNVLIGIISPGPWGSINPFKTDKMSTLDAHDDATVNNMAINDFAEKYVSTLKDFAKMYSLPFLDLYHESNLRPWNDDFINSYYHGQSPTDTTHPNPDAMKKFIAPKIAKFIESFV